MKIKGKIVFHGAQAEKKGFTIVTKKEDLELVTSFNGKYGDVSTYLGQYETGKTYNKGDIISYNGAFYMALIDTSVQPQGITDTNWAMIKDIYDLKPCTQADIEEMWED